MNQKRNTSISFIRIVFLTALLAGTLDIAAAFINSYLRAEVSPVIVLQFIASGILGDASFEGGILTALLGLIFHYFIAFTWTFIFFTFYPKIIFFQKIVPTNQYKIILGLSYGIIIWLIMNLIVLPLSNVPPIPFRFPQVVIGISFIMFLVGLPISLMFFKTRRDKYHTDE